MGPHPMRLVLDHLSRPDAATAPAEIVERKGRGHPDSLCDALAEQASLALSRAYRARFGQVVHHNVDKVLLFGGRSTPAFGGGEVHEPIEIYLAGRAVRSVRGAEIDVDGVVRQSCLDLLRERLHAIDVDREVRLHLLIRPGSADLVELFERQGASGVWLSNDTSIGVGYAPLSPLEQSVLGIERRLNTPRLLAAHPEIGEDIKVMGVRDGPHADLTVACGLIGRHLADLGAYVGSGARIAAVAQGVAARHGFADATTTVNAGDDVAAGSVYLTVTGTSAESGDDGEAGRGNRANGLITPYRPMTMESVAGKNPVSHVGKLYNLAAGMIAQDLVAERPELGAAECFLVSRIGAPVDRPSLVDIRTATGDPADQRLRNLATGLAHARLDSLARLHEQLLSGAVAFDRWPFAASRLPPAAEDARAAERAGLADIIAEEFAFTAGATGRPKPSRRLLEAIRRVPRHLFVDTGEADLAYANCPLPIGYGQTISQPYIVALMTDVLDLGEDDNVLEIGTGSGYQAAVLAELAREVHSIECVAPLGRMAGARLARLGYDGVDVRVGDGKAGMPGHAPYDAIIATAAAGEVPPALLRQLAPGGRLVIPIGPEHGEQRLVLVDKRDDGSLHRSTILDVQFVPMR
jgi:S-adenosylmethionine synthetase